MAISTGHELVHVHRVQKRTDVLSHIFSLCAAITRSSFAQFCVHNYYLRPWLDHPLITVYSTLCTSYTLWTVDQVIFFHSRPYGGMMTLSQQPRCNVVHGLTPLLCGIGYVLS